MSRGNVAFLCGYRFRVSKSEDIFPIQILKFENILRFEVHVVEKSTYLWTQISTPEEVETYEMLVQVHY
jgi:hypothetical protein